MKTFIFRDEKSHKFWSIEHLDNELHLRWGKVGTSGQSQIKTFADTAAASHAEQKLINEKKRKGYVEADTDTQLVNADQNKETAFPATEPPLKNSLLPGDMTRPWLADDAQLVLPERLLDTVLPSRAHPGNPIPAPEERMLMDLGNILNDPTERLAFNYADCSADWQQIITEALNNGDLSPSALAVQVAIKIYPGWRNDDCPELMDEIVEVYGLEYAVEMLIALQHIEIERQHSSGTRLITFHPEPTQPRSPGMFQIRLRAHLAQAEESLWQRCVDKLIAALPDMPIGQQPLVALLIPERQDIVNEIAHRVLAVKHVKTAEWLKLVACDPQVVKALEPYQEEKLFSQTYNGELWTATVMRDQGMRGISRFAPYADSPHCGELISQINHPQALMQLICVSEHKYGCFDRMNQTITRFPHAALAAFAELLAQKEENRWRIMLMVQLNAQPELAAQISPWLSPQAQAVLESCQQRLNPQGSCASPDMLPTVLVSPPWTMKKKKPSVAQLDLAPLPLEPVFTVSEKALKELTEARAWYVSNLMSGKSTLKTNKFLQYLGFRSSEYSVDFDLIVDAWKRQDFPELIKQQKAFYDRHWNLQRLAILPVAEALTAWNELSKEPHTGTEIIMAYLGVAGLQGFIHSLSRYPQEYIPFALGFAASELAPIIARAFNKMKTRRKEARKWLLSYPEHAIVGLLPAALGKVGEAQESARLAIRLLVENGHQPLVEEIAQRYQQPEVVQAVSALLALDPLDNHPIKIPALPAFCQPKLWTRPVLRESGKLLPDEALKPLCEMLRFPVDDGIYPGLLQVKALCTAESLAAFGWDMFSAWRVADCPAKEGWAFRALGTLGNDDTARALTPLIRIWPGESQHKRATTGLDILAAIGSDIALMQLNGIAQKLKFKALQERAREKINEVAESRNLTTAELEDRLAPNPGLNDDGTLPLDFGPRRFIVSFDEALKPWVRDENGKRLKDLPKPNKSDDNELAADAVNRYKTLKKDTRMIASQQIARLESAMCQRRRWTPDNFYLFLVSHPLVCHLTRRLVWGVYSEEDVLLDCFRVAEDNSYSTADDDLFTLPDGDIRIGLPHRLEITQEDAAAFGQLFADYELLSPFRQLDRICHSLSPAELESVELTRWAGRKCPSGRVAGLANKGWLRGVVLDGGWIGWILKPLGELTLVVELDQGFSVAMAPDMFSPEQTLCKIWLCAINAHQYGWGGNNRQPVPFSALDRVSISELINDIDALFE